ncbi:helix-turn-helix transcriptional regulator [Burkholderia sp. JKS000303]|uniref:helix-turn-helix transcriptional regulator n=1 Tax=Burkholderia sp. JKS000303 TaxID=1938747 RepID=UPI000C009EFD|nr:helix-turn-helix transcriptional regulator [Burkholderia sp. JKS000303]PFH29419.1 DNA-binding CsgD family transcriptional regulator [Burkholderia sp. JKS000303]
MPAHNADSPGTGELLYRIHAARDEDAWRGVMAQLRERFDAASAVLAQRHLARGQGEVLYGAPDDPAFARVFAEYAPRNPWFLSTDACQPLHVSSGDEILGGRELVGTDYYKALLHPQRLRHRLCGVVARDDDALCYVELYRSEGQRRFGAKEKSEFRGLLAHIALAMENRWHRRHAADLEQALMHVVDGHANATFLVEPDGRIAYSNRNAQALCEQDSGLYRDGPYLAAVTPADQRALRETLADLARQAGEGGPRAGLPPTQVLSVSSPGARLPTTLTLQPAGASLRGGAEHARVLLVVSARRQRAEHAHHDCSFARQFKLSDAQARVSALIFDGHSIATLAQTLHVSENTVRSHLKQVFQKTNTHGQMELVRLHAQHCPNA